MLRNPETGTKFLPSKTTTKYGVYIDTEGNSQFSSPEEVREWQFVVAAKGLAYALYRFFNRSEFPKIQDKSN